jgi:hypothetical protein
MLESLLISRFAIIDGQYGEYVRGPVVWCIGTQIYGNELRDSIKEDKIIWVPETGMTMFHAISQSVSQMAFR